MRYTKIGAVLVLALGMAVPVHAREYDLGGAVSQALKANPGVEAKLEALEKARMDVGVARGYFLPRVSLVASSTKLRNSGDAASVDDLSSKTDSFGLRLTLSLFSGFSHLHNLQRAKIEESVAAARQQQAELELCVNVQSQFLRLLKARKDMKTVQTSISRLETQLKAAQAFVRVGMAPQLSVLQTEVELSNARQEEFRVASQIRACEMQLNQFLGFDPSARVQYVGVLEDFPQHVGFSEDEAIQRAMNMRPDLLVAQKSVEAMNAQSKVSAGRFLPQVDLNVDAMQFRRDYDERRYTDYSRHYTSVGIQFSWELFSGGQTAYTIAGDRRQMRSLELEYENARTLAQTDIRKAMMDIHTAAKVLETARRGVIAAREGYDMAQKRYNSTIGTITELLDAQTSLTEAEASVSQALMEYQSARAQFFFYIGLKNIDLH